MIFSIDAAVAFSIILLGALVFTLVLLENTNKATQSAQGFALEEKALMIADAMVKNHDENNTLLGACIVDADKKRTKTNELSGESIKKAKSINFGKIFVKSISYETKKTKESIQLDSKAAKQCITARRFALIDGEKSIILIQTCEEG